MATLKEAYQAGARAAAMEKLAENDEPTTAGKNESTLGRQFAARSLGGLAGGLGGYLTGGATGALLPGNLRQRVKRSRTGKAVGGLGGAGLGVLAPGAGGAIGGAGLGALLGGTSGGALGATIADLIGNDQGTGREIGTLLGGGIGAVGGGIGGYHALKALQGD